MRDLRLRVFTCVFASSRACVFASSRASSRIHELASSRLLECIVVLVRIYDEVDSDGNILKGNGNPKCKYFHLPLQCMSPMDYYLSENILGHVIIRLKPIEKIKGKSLARMYKETRTSNRADLITNHDPHV